MSGQVLFCRMCDSAQLRSYLNLGHMPPADSFLSSKTEVEQRFPLEVKYCKDCGLSQLSYVVDPKILYCNNYPYDASTAKTAQKHWQNFADSICAKRLITKNDLVVDIGSNVGVLLQAFKNNDTKVLGVDPASNIAKIAQANGIETIASFFTEEVAASIVRKYGRAKIITGTNVFAHIDDLNGLMKAVQILLKEDGAFIFEVPYFVNLVKKLQYDTIYHEHLSYISIQPLVKFFKKFNMEIFNIEDQDFHGGSIRVYVRNRQGKDQSYVIDKYLGIEKAAGIYKFETLTKFAAAVEENRTTLRKLIWGLKREGRSIAVVSAPAKGMTLLNFCGIDNTVVDFATEKAKLKIGKYTPGTRIPVVSDGFLLDKSPDYALLLAWNFADEIIKNNPRYKGRYIIPIPNPRIV